MPRYTGPPMDLRNMALAWRDAGQRLLRMRPTTPRSMFRTLPPATWLCRTSSIGCAARNAAAGRMRLGPTGYNTGPKGATTEARNLHFTDTVIPASEKAAALLGLCHIVGEV
jgi:hypothetical protein